jgi:hypothetical protein
MKNFGGYTPVYLKEIDLKAIFLLVAQLKYYKLIIHLSVILSYITRLLRRYRGIFPFKILYAFLVLPIITTFLLHP